MEIIIQKNQEAASQAAANALVKSIQQNPELVIGLASGESPRRLYEILVEMENRGEVFFEECTFFSLDEYVGLGENHPASYKRYFEENFFSKLKYRPSRVHTPDGRAADIEGFCRSYEDSIRSAGGIDLQILGIGKDGHLAFNEPGSSLASRTRIKTLTPGTLRANKKLFGGGDIRIQFF
jgi:glucosamine-6-phosphate deaminase